MHLASFESAREVYAEDMARIRILILPGPIPPICPTVCSRDKQLVVLIPFPADKKWQTKHLGHHSPPKQQAVTCSTFGNINSKSTDPSGPNRTIREPPHLFVAQHLSKEIFRRAGIPSAPYVATLIEDKPVAVGVGSKPQGDCVRPNPPTRWFTSADVVVVGVNLVDEGVCKVPKDVRQGNAQT
jgi:hypothetical protein